MLLLSAPFDPGAAAAPRRPRAALVAIAGLAGLLVAAGVAWELLGRGPAGLGRALALGAAHAGLIGLGWVLTTAAPGWWRPVIRLGVAVILATIAARLVPWGPARARAPADPAAGGGRGASAAARAGAGAVSDRPRRPGSGRGRVLRRPSARHRLADLRLPPGPQTGARAYASALAYDVGANVLSAEWLFRGAVFSALWRRGGFWPAALASTALALLRYLIDPALPHAPEARAGAVFYLGLVGLTGCALRAWSGSLLPGYLAGLGFFAAYRLLTP